MQIFLDELFPTDYAVSNQTDAPNAVLVGTTDGMDDQVIYAEMTPTLFPDLCLQPPGSLYLHAVVLHMCRHESQRGREITITRSCAGIYPGCSVTTFSLNAKRDQLGMENNWGLYSKLPKYAIACGR